MNYYRVITYNVYWKNMKYKPECVKNINLLLNNKFNTNNLGDFIFLQESANRKKLLKNLDSNFNIINYTSGKETITTLINKKYTIIQKLGGQFMSGRPFLIVLLNNNICLINVHLPHSNDLMKELTKIEKYLENSKINLKNYRIIMGGDFNIEINNKITFMNKKLTHTKDLFSCCSEYYDKSKFTKKYDYILDSNNKIKGRLLYPKLRNIILPASDHFGVYAKLLK